MLLTTLLENSSVDDSLVNKHGLSIHIELGKLIILFDTGPDSSFYKNAIKLGIDISKVDYLIVSHGHYDHAGGLETFIKHNDRARIIISDKAFKEYYAKKIGLKKYIGISDQIKVDERFILVDDYYRINDNLFVFGNVSRGAFFPSGNKSLFVKEEDTLIHDVFDHEINLVVKENSINTLFLGCGHMGLPSINDYVTSHFDETIHHVVGGLHLYNPVLKTTETKDILNKLSQYVNDSDIKSLYTCHCTGLKAYDFFKKSLTCDIHNLSTGKIVQK